MSGCSSRMRRREAILLLLVLAGVGLSARAEVVDLSPDLADTPAEERLRLADFFVEMLMRR